MGGRAHPHRARRTARLITGEIVTLREVWRDRTLAERRVRVLRDVPGVYRAFYLAPGSRFLNDPRDHGEVRFHDGPWELETVVRDRPVLSFAFSETAYAVLLSWTPTWEFRGYYVNMQSPLRQAEPGAFEYTDWFLDVRIPPTLDIHEWKDEHELTEAVSRGLVTDAAAIEIRAAGERAIEHVIGRRPPFDEDWSSWRPEEAWGPLHVTA